MWVSVRKEPVWIGVGIVASVAVGWMTTAVLNYVPHIDWARITVVVLTVAIGVFAWHVRRGGWFRPFGFPFLYAAVALLVPLVWLGVLGRPIGAVRPIDLTTPVVLVFSLTVAGWVAGTVVGLRAKGARSRPAAVSRERMLWLGRLFMLSALVIRLWSLRPGAYGVGQTSFSTESALLNFAIFLLFAGVVLICASQAPLRLGSAFDYLVFASFSLATLYRGSRGELIAPVIFALWTYHVRIRRLRLWRILLVAAVAAFVFQGVAGSRSGQTFYAGADSATARVIQGLGPPVYVTEQVVRRVPLTHGFYHGSTYVAAIKRQLPGPLANHFFGLPNDTGAFVFRQLLSYQNPNNGFSFSLPSEGYLNFGLPGAFGAGAFVGFLLGWSYRKLRVPPTRVHHLLYPLILSTIPLGIRTDALGEIKMVLYSALLVMVALALAQSKVPVAEPAARVVTA